MKNEGKTAKHGFKIMTAVITVCAVLCTVFSAMSLVLQYKDHIMLKKYGDFVSYENLTKNADEKDGFYLVTKEAKAEGESDTAANAETESAAGRFSPEKKDRWRFYQCRTDCSRVLCISSQTVSTVL